MKKNSYLTSLLIACGLLCSGQLAGQDTFSIVAADSATGEVGSAGASCIDASWFAPKGAHIISVIEPGVGSVNCQASLVLPNKSTAESRLKAGDNAYQIIKYTTENDIDSDSTIRQYGAVTIDTTGKVETHAFTGDSCLDYKSHIIGPNYTIQGNILSGQPILDSMEARFLNTQGSLADKLMAALQGANIPGADTRCLSEGRSSQSAFIRLAKPNDFPGNLYMDLATYNVFNQGEPIDALQDLYDNFVPDTTTNTSIEEETKFTPKITIANGEIQIQDTYDEVSHIQLTNSLGQIVHKGKELKFRPNLENGVYYLSVEYVRYRYIYKSSIHYQR